MHTHTHTHTHTHIRMFITPKRKPKPKPPKLHASNPKQTHRLPKQRRTGLFSATMSTEVAALVSKVLVPRTLVLVICLSINYMSEY
jgi:hypothetical protein